MDSQGACTKRIKWKEEHRDPVRVFAESERVAQRVKQVRVEKTKWIGKSLMIVPPKNPGDEIRITWIDHGVAQARDVRPGNNCREETEGREDKNFPQESTA